MRCCLKKAQIDLSLEMTPAVIQCAIAVLNNEALQPSFIRADCGTCRIPPTRRYY